MVVSYISNIIQSQIDTDIVKDLIGRGKWGFEKDRKCLGLMGSDRLIVG